MSDLSSDSSSDSETPVSKKKGKKRKANPQLWKKNHLKTARLEGAAHVSIKGKQVAAKVTGPDCSCKRLCMKKISDEEKNSIISRLYNGQSKNEKDTFLMGLIESKPVKRRRRRSEENIKPRASNFSYFAMKGSSRVSVCKQAFMSLHAISHVQVQRLTTIILSGNSPNDGRGKHNNRPHAIKDEYVVKIKEHIESFPTKTSHYSSKTVKYLKSDLNIKTMHNLFVEIHPHLKNTIKYEYYLKFFNENYDLKFGRPQVDVCSECEHLGARIKDNNLNDTAKRVAAAQLIVHKRRANKFYNKLKEVAKLCEEKPNVSALCFDFMQNLPLPQIPVQEVFYYRQLWVNVFEIHNMKENSGHCYVYHEGQAHKGPNEVCTFLNDYIKNKIPDSIQELHLFSDACPGQNRNHTFVRFLMALQASKRFKIIYHYFPVRGHSYLPCDRDFGTIKRNIRKHDRVYLPQEYEDMITTSRKTKPFTVKTVTHEDIVNFKDWWPTVYKKTSKSINKVVKDKFNVSEYRMFVYDSTMPGYVKTYDFIDGLNSKTFKMVKNKANQTLPENRAYTEPVSINDKKIQDIIKLIKYVPNEALAFYNGIFAWKTTEEEYD